ncbi:hypothetical protein HMPREF1624_05636 [Sporothrix schenckii ATCC 58251]|uniref:Protein NO VEIN C-terminal domain-containing protein n=1 Tax=Sporothrix schenckii (strain ATCC 58251 / de Perez 2211183) TaxID=1391915 RepID=U7PPC0_SPOS1|nr:hypothetical protein HMPREF1624_05636 [Sporothrix schenckii ATCC 58251]
MATMTGRDVAKQIVLEMGKKNGYIPDEVLAEMQHSLSEKSCNIILDAVSNLKHQAATSVKTLAQNLYSSSAKFVFELLQNYDDNHYDSDRGPPSVAFHIYPDRIVASCNENGFTEENVSAICSVGQSSKKKTNNQLAGDVGYTGEKGIGFKSVFMAAEEVHIQSGDYSFRFKYPKGDSGLGMMTPIWTDYNETLDAQLSHITLTLRNDGQLGDAVRRQEIIHEQFYNIHDSILLFMKKLQEIKVSFYDSEENLQSTTTFSIDRLRHQTTVKKSVTTFDNQNTEQVTDVVKSYVMIKHIVRDLAPNENRKDLDSEAQTTTDGVVVLGFPIDTHSEPVLQNEYIFAFLPVKIMGFKFLIHADFVTQANREDIVVTSDRNHGLARGIAEAFIMAVSQFSTHATLRYQWMRYLPRDSDYPWDGFWKSVIQDIRSRLGRMAILQSQDASQPLLSIGDSRRLLPSMLDSDGAPLVPDIAPCRYLSQEYQHKDLILLEDYGLTTMSNWEWVERVEHDLASDASVMKSTDDEDWHMRVADLLYALSDSESEEVREAVQQLQLFPLRDGSWVSASPGPVYCPQPEGTSLVIPPRVNLAVVDATAFANVSRERLFNKLGARAAPVKTVREAIFKEHQNLGTSSIQWTDLVQHTHFLYLTHHLVSSPYDYNRLSIGPRKGHLKKSCNTDVDMYIADGTPYGVEILLSSDNDAPGFEPLFVMADVYFKDVLSLPTPTSPTFKDWLHIFHGVRRDLRLIHTDGKALSPIGNYIAEHRPEKFLGFLQRTWGGVVLPSSDKKLITGEIANLEVLCQEGKKVRLGSTYFPLGSLKKLSERFLVDEFFPWLQLESEITDDEVFLSSWAALGKAFGLGYHCTTLSFLLDILRYIKKHTFAEDIVNPRRIYELYVRIQAEVQAASPEDGLIEQIRLAFNSDELIFTGHTDSACATWSCPEDCVWESPVDMINKGSIARRCQSSFPDLFVQERSNLQNFFSTTLQIRDAYWRDLQSEIVYMHDNDIHDLYKAKELYTRLSECLESLDEDELSELKDEFKRWGLIYVSSEDDPDDGGWYTPNECLWTSATKIRGKVTLSVIYPDLKSFFMDCLGMRTMTVKMVYDKLTGPLLSVEDTKQTIHAFNSLLVQDADAREMVATNVFEKQVFPVRLPGGTVQLCQGTDSFFLVNRQSLADEFAGQVKLFDFDMGEVRSLQPFIAWVGLGHKYLSKMVRENSCVVGDDKRPISCRDRDIRRKARALLSLAVAYNSPRVYGSREKSFYTLLRHAETIETDRITSELHLDQDGKVLKVERAAATFHIQDDDTSVKFYVPRDETTQELCFNATLPKSICLWMMANPMTTIGSDMIFAAQAILCAKCVAMNVILDHHGIKLASVPEGEDDDEDEEVVAPQTSIEAPGRSSIEAPGRSSIEAPGRSSVEEPGRPLQVDEVAVTTRSISLASVPQQRVATFHSNEEEIISSRSNTPFTFSGQAEAHGSGMTPDSITFASPTTATTASIVTISTTVTDDGELYLSSLFARTHVSTDSASPVSQAPDNSYSVLLDLVVQAATQASIPSRGNVSMSTIQSTGA